jgi:hypothetical protein
MSVFSSSSYFRNVAMLAGAAVVLGLASPGFAQTPNPGNDQARCQVLYGQWTKYNGGSAYSKQLDADTAAEQCRKGNTTAGIADLTRILERARIPVPQTETATTK